MIPEFALIGHPNEGKSSILSTLSEDDSVIVSATPGETTLCTSFPVRVDGEEILKFTDTPGFQNPGRLLHELKQLIGTPEENLNRLSRVLKAEPHLAHDHELLTPLSKGAGVIYVVDGSRPVRQVDRTEMEILRLLGRPRMAIINCKEQENHLQEWKNEFRRSFNSYRVFNAHKASYTERIHLLQALCHIDQDWQHSLRHAIDVLEKDWDNRTNATTEIILSLLEKVIPLTLNQDLTGSPQECASMLLQKYSTSVNRLEQKEHRKIRALFKHNIFNYQLPPHSLLHEDIFTSTNWKALGLSKKQLLVAGGMGGAAIGASADIAIAGLGFGVFTIAGGVGGMVSALLGGNSIAKKKSSFAGIQLAGENIQIGPAQDIHLLFVLLNRALLFYRHSINWAHGRRDFDSYSSTAITNVNENFTKNLTVSELKTCHKYFQNISNKTDKKQQQNEKKFRVIVHNLLESFYK